MCDRWTAAICMYTYVYPHTHICMQAYVLAHTARKREHRIVVSIEDGVRVEIDVYGGVLSGLVVAEVEFESIEDARAFVPFDWLGEEISGNARYRNNVLARLGRVPDEGEV